jgi:drug/metabolite transporter superfamily protein YnfA
MTFLAWLIFIVAALLEVGGDALIRKGLAFSNLGFMAGGFLLLGCYGLVVNLVRWDFSKLLGVYVALFALVSILWGHFILKETVPISTWLGLMIIIVGGLII